MFIIVGHFIAAVCAAAVARPQAQHRQAAHHRDLDPVRARSPTTTGTSPLSSTRTGCQLSLLDVALPLALGGIFISLFVSQPAAAVRCCRSTIRTWTRRCITMSTEHDRATHDLEYGPTPPGAKHEHTDIDAVDRLQVRAVAGGGDADLGRHRLRHVLVLRGPGDGGRPRWRSSIRSPPGSTRSRRRRTCRTSRSRTSTCCGRAKREKLTSYGWVDKEGGVARIPIDRAMDVMLERGFPARADGGNALNVVTQDSSSGRTTFRGSRQSKSRQLRVESTGDSEQLADRSDRDEPGAHVGRRVGAGQRAGRAAGAGDAVAARCRRR